MWIRVAPIAIATILLSATCTTKDEGATTSSSPVSPPVATAVEAAPIPGATLAVALQNPEAISAHHSVTSAALDIASLLNTGLTSKDANGIAHPALAATWSTLDQKTWTFNLNSNLRFNDGTAISAQSVVDSWSALASQETRSRNAYLGLVAGISGWGEVLSGETGQVIGAHAIDQLSLQIQLDEPFPWLPELLAHPAFAPVAASELTAPDIFAPVGTGPFRIAEPWDPGEVLRLVRVSGGGYSGSVSHYEITFTSSDAEAAGLASRGDVDLAVIGSAPDPGGDVTVHALATDSLIYMGFPVTRAPTDEPSVRMALIHAIDRDRIRSDVIGDESILNNLYAPAHAAGANLLLCTACEYDPDLSRSLLEEVEPPTNSLSVHVVEGSAAEPWAHAIATLWQDELGWPVAVVPHDLPGLIGFLQSGVPDGPFLLEWASEYPAAESWLEPLFDRAGLDDFTRFSDRDINRSLNDLAALSSDSPNRTSHLKDIRTVLAERVPTIPLAVTTRRVAIGAGIDPDSLAIGSHLRLDELVWLP